MSEGVRVGVEDLELFVAGLFSDAGMTGDNAREVASCLVQTDLWGIGSHGVLRAPIYLQRLRNGAVRPRPDMRVVGGKGAVRVLDGDAGMGFVVGREAMMLAISAAREQGVGICAVRNSNHFGAAGLYARMAAAEGMVGMALTNVMPNVVAPGGSKPVTGNNPLAIAVPSGGDFPLVLDISLSAVAGGKLLLASKRSERIPLDWATDREGRPTDDPDIAFEGFLLPLGGVKGLGLSYLVDVLCGVLSGGAFGWGVKSMYAQPDAPSETAHLMLAVNVQAFMSREEFDERLAEFCESIKNSPMWDERAEMLLPGEPEFRSDKERRAEGIVLPRELYDELLALGGPYGRTLAPQTP